MTDAIADVSPRKAARVAGAGYLIIILCGIFAEFVVRSSLVVPGDAAATAARIAASESLFRLGFAGDLVMLVCDALVAVALYVLLRPVNRGLALLATALRLVHTAVYAANLLNLSFALQLLSGAGYLSAFEPAQLHALALFFLDGHGNGYPIGLVFFGLHCLVLGYLVYRSGYLPRVLGVLLYAASAGYLVDSFSNFLLPNYADYADTFLLVVAVPAVVAELSLSLWLLVKGADLERVRAS